MRWYPGVSAKLTGELQVVWAGETMAATIVRHCAAEL